MNDALRTRIVAALEAARAAAPSLPASRRSLALRPLDTALDRLARPLPSASEILELTRAATTTALVQAMEGELDPILLEALADAYGALLTALAQRRLTVAPPHRNVDELKRVTEGEPTVVSVVRAAFVEGNAVGPWATESQLALEGTDGSNHRDSPTQPGVQPIASAASERPELPEPTPQARPDWRPEEGLVADPPPVRLDPERHAVSRSDLHTRVVESALEGLAGIARERDEVAFSERAHSEASALALSDAILATSGDPIGAALNHWAKSVEAPGGYASWAAAFALARFEGADALAAIRAGLEALPADAEEHGRGAADALAIVPHPDAATLAQDLVESAHPVARAVGVDLAGRRAVLPPDGLRAHVLDPSLPVMLAALRAISRMSANEGAPLRPLLLRLIYFPDRRVAYLASLCLIGWGDDAPYADLVSHGRLAPILGPLSLEILVLLGEARDKELFAQLARRTPLARNVLSALGRFGHPEAWQMLLHCLGDQDLVDDAARALETLFGPLVPPEEARSIAAWKAAISSSKPDSAVRLRVGQPWSPGIVADELTAGVLARHELEVRLRELSARARIGGQFDLSAWGAVATSALSRAAAEARRVAPGWRRTGW